MATKRRDLELRVAELEECLESIYSQIQDILGIEPPAEDGEEQEDQAP